MHTRKEGGTHKEAHILQKGHKDTWRKRHAHTEKGTHTEQEILREKRKADTQGERNTHKVMEEIERTNGREMNTERYTQRKKHKQRKETQTQEGDTKLIEKDTDTYTEAHTQRKIHMHRYTQKETHILRLTEKERYQSERNMVRRRQRHTVSEREREREGEGEGDGEETH